MNPRLRAIRVTLCGALLAALPGCWSQPLATQVEPTASPMTRPPSSGEAGPAAAQPGQPTGVSVPSPAALAHISSAGFVPPTETRSELQNGLSIVVRADSASRGPLARTALLRIVLPAGRRDAATANVELAAMMLLAASEHGEPSLEAAIHDLGGRAMVTVGVEDSAIDIAVPVESAAHALLHLASALQREPRSEPQLEIVRLRLLREWRARCNSAPFETLVRRLLAEPTTTPTEFLARTQEATLEDIRSGWRLLSQPTGAALAITVPGGEKPEVVHAGAKLAFSAWSSLVRPRATRPPDLLPPVVWAQGNDVPRGAFVLLRPEIGDKLDVELLVLLECLSHKGLGGRLGKAFERLLGSGPPLTSEAVSVGSRTIALLHAATTPEQAVTWPGAMRSALESLVRERPDGDELVAAAGRVRLALVEQCADPKAWAAGATARTQERRKDDALARAITRLEDPLSLSLAAALPELPSHLLTLLVHGGTPPAESKVMLLEQPLPPERVASSIDSDQAEREQAAKPFLELAIVALGGRDLLSRIQGYVGSCDVSAGNAMVASDQVWYRGDAHVRRIRKVLATTIELTVTASEGSEASGDQQVTLAAEEAAQHLHRASRHPLALVTAWLHGKARFKLVSVREIEGREMAILELIDPTRERLRVQVDAQSGLIRQVETREVSPGMGRVQVVEKLSDYRAHKGLRSPFHMLTIVGSAPEPIVTDWREVYGRTPDDAELARGGPVDLGKTK
jgi:hypothetical protein